MYPSCSFHFFLRLKGRSGERGRDRERAGFRPLVHSLHVCSSQGWARQKPGAPSGSPQGWQGPACGSAPFSAASLAGSRVRNGAARPRTSGLFWLPRPHSSGAARQRSQLMARLGTLDASAGTRVSWGQVSQGRAIWGRVSRGSVRQGRVSWGQLSRGQVSQGRGQPEQGYLGQGSTWAGPAGAGPGPWCTQPSPS